MSKIIEIPANLQTDFLIESRADSMPDIRREGNIAIYPAFIREETITDEDGSTRTGYRYFLVEVPYTGQNLTDEAAFVHASYAAIRKYFYGDFSVQNEQMLKGTFAAHQYAVRLAFPKSATEVIEAVERFDAIKLEFWNAVDAACVLMGCTRADLPEHFTAEQMLAFATTHGMSADKIAEYTQIFSVVSLNLLHNGRNWDELYE